MAIKNGDLVKLEYTAYSGDTVIDTTDEKLAPKIMVFTTKRKNMAQQSLKSRRKPSFTRC